MSFDASDTHSWDIGQKGSSSESDSGPGFLNAE